MTKTSRRRTPPWVKFFSGRHVTSPNQGLPSLASWGVKRRDPGNEVVPAQQTKKAVIYHFTKYEAKTRKISSLRAVRFLYFNRTEFSCESQSLMLNNQVLVGQNYKSVITRGIFGCGHKCLTDPACTSYNYQHSASQGGLCELNEECTEQRKSERFEERRGFVLVRIK